MSQATIYKEKRLTSWLKKALVVKGLVASSRAPIDDHANESISTDASPLQGLANELGEEVFSYTTTERYEHQPVPFELRRLVRHEGLSLATQAILKPANTEELERCLTLTHRSGLNILADEHLFPLETHVIISPERMCDIELISQEDGIVKFGAGTTWTALDKVARDNHLATPDKARDLFPTPAQAATAGFLKCRSKEEIRQITTAFEIALPPQHTKWLDRFWLFRNEKKAREAYRNACRSGQCVLAQFVSAAELQLAHQAGFLRLPRKKMLPPDFAAVRLIFQGPAFTVYSTEFAAAWPMEWKGGVQWNNHQLPGKLDKTVALQEIGLNPVTVSTKTTFKDLDTMRQRLTEALKKSAKANSPAASFEPLIIDQARHLSDELELSVTIIPPRDYLYPVDQWQAIYADGLQATGQHMQTAIPVTEESPEWRAIRDALLDDDGQLRPFPADADSTVTPEANRTHG